MMFWIYVFGAFVATTAALNLPGVPVDFNVSDKVLSDISAQIAEEFAEEYITYFRSGKESAKLRQISKQLAKTHSKKDLFTKESEDLGIADQFVLCTTCRATANVAARMVREEDGELNGPEAENNARFLMLDMCRRLELQTEEVCNGLFDGNWKTIEYVTNESKMDSYSFCSLFMEYSFCNIKNPDYNWTLTIDNTGEPVTGPKSTIPQGGADDLNILQLTDIHYDPLYQAGSLAECVEPICCQRDKDTAEGTSKAAGYWGDYRDCDAPWQMIENAFQHIKETHKIDYIYQTGDVVDHMVWATSKEKNKASLTKVDDELFKLFPDVKVYPCIGNHEPHPLNAFSPEDVPEEVNTKWMYEVLYESWSRWLPATTKETILKGGYYTVSPRPGFRIIALNNNDCYNMNWWLFYSGLDKQIQLEWLHDTLLDAEKNNEYVHMLAHIPSGDGSCWSVWAREYNRIVERFRNTISAVFNGHSHKDDMYVHFSTNGYPIGITYNGGSLTTYSNKNPNYRIYQAEPKSMQIVNHETWIFNLTLANEKGQTVKPVWFKEYDFVSEFTADTSPNGINKLLDTFAEEPNMLRKFWRYKNTMADPKLAEGCDNGCLMGTLCRLAMTVNDQPKRCNELTARLAIALDDETSTTSSSTVTSAPTSGPTNTPPSGSTSSSSTTDPSTPTEETPEDDGAASLIALSFSSIVTLHLLVKYFV